MERVDGLRQLGSVEPAFFDAPLDRIEKAGNLVVNQPPPEPNADFSRCAPCCETLPADRTCLRARVWRAYLGVERSFVNMHPLPCSSAEDKMCGAARLVHRGAGISHPDFDAPVEKQIAAVRRATP